MAVMATFILKPELNFLRVLDIVHNLWLSQSVSSSSRSAHGLRTIFASNTILPLKKSFVTSFPGHPTPLVSLVTLPPPSLPSPFVSLVQLISSSPSLL